ncbi:hypothetical protein DFR74_12536 [Nocardia puris]|uniref:Uncharacterized protein n=1 Tax=Nocardia puris TaxID=208602 RepID=A0A366CW69_9NOCA|nr:hypothetical protein DFR74_12536 [Nocardia puris]
MLSTLSAIANAVDLGEVARGVLIILGAIVDGLL